MRRIHIIILLVTVAVALARVFMPAPPPRAAENPFDKVVREAERASLRDEHQRAIDMCTRALADPRATDDDRRKLLRKRGSAHEWAHDYAEAEADFNAALAIQPPSADIYFRRGYFYQRRKRYDEALADFAAGKRLRPTDGWFDFGEGEIYTLRGDHRTAIAHYSEAIRLKPEMTQAYLKRSSEYNYVGKFREAKDDYDVVLRDRWAKHIFSPRAFGHVYLGHGYAALQLGEYRRALDDFNQVLKVVPDASNALAWRGGAWHGLGDRAHAVADYQAALALDPANAYAKAGLAILQKR